MDGEYLELLMLLARLYKVAAWLMKGVRYIVVPDYAELNDVFYRCERLLIHHGLYKPEDYK